MSSTSTASSTAARPPIHIGRALREVFVDLITLHQDVLHDMGEAEECLIDGESLFMEAVLDVRCPAAFSGVPLQLIYNVEMFLTKLHGQGGRFRIVFFDKYDVVWFSIPEVAALREIFIAHMCRALPPHTVLRFPFWRSLPRHEDEQIGPNNRSKSDPEGAGNGQCFRELLTSMRPAFVLVSSLLEELPKLQDECNVRSLAGRHVVVAADGATAAELGPSKCPPGAGLRCDAGDCAKDTLDDMQTCRRRLLQSSELQHVAELSMALLLHCLCISSPVILMSSLDLNASTRPFGFILEPELNMRCLQFGKLLDAMHAISYRICSLAVLAQRRWYSERMAGELLARRTVGFLVNQQEYTANGGPVVLTCRAALAAAVCSFLQGQEIGANGCGDAIGADGSEDAALRRWLCEVYLLHAVFLDFLPLEHRSLALPYGVLRGLYGNGHFKHTSSKASQLSIQMQGYFSEQILPLVAAAVQSRTWTDVTTTSPGSSSGRGSGGRSDPGTTPSALSPAQLCLSAVWAALADPYQGPLLQALVVALLIMRSEMSTKQTKQAKPQQQRLPPATVGSVDVNLPPAAVQAWQVARRLAGFAQPQQHADLKRDGQEAESAEAALLIRHLLDSMPFSSADKGIASALSLLVKGPKATATSDVVAGSAGSGDEGFPSRLDRKAQEMLMEASRLPELLRRTPVVQTVDQLWPCIVPKAAEMLLPPQAVSASEPTIPPLKKMGRGTWGPWKDLVAPFLQSGGGDPGDSRVDFVEGDVEEIYHWHTRQPLQPAFLTQSDSRDDNLRRALSQVHRTPTEMLMVTFQRYMHRLHRFRLNTLLREMRQGLRLTEEPKSVVIEGLHAYLQVQRNKEEASLKRLIDSLQGGVTFFRAAGRSICGSSSAQLSAPQQQQQQQEFPLLVSKLEDVVNMAHLDAIRKDREGKDRLAQLLQDARMSLPSLRVKLQNVEASRGESQRRTSERHGNVMQAEVERWTQTVVPFINRFSAGIGRVEEVISALQRLCSPASTVPELRSIAAVLQLQLHLATLYRLSEQGRKLPLANDDNAGSEDGADNGVARPAARPALGHFLHAGGKVVMRAGSSCVVGAAAPSDTATPSDAGNGGGSGDGNGDSVVERHGGKLPAALQQALLNVLLSLSSFKAVCRGGGRALWLQPCPLLTDPRVAAPCVIIACAALGALGFGDAAERLRLEAGYPEETRLNELAKIMNAQRKALSKVGVGGDRSKSSSGGSSGSAKMKGKAKEKEAKAKKEKIESESMKKGKAEKEGFATVTAQAVSSGQGCGVYPLEGVDDAILSGYDKITYKSSDMGFTSLALGVSLVRFQLLCMGDRLERLSSGAPDSRVGFIPDEWQRRLLDIVDAGSSAVVSAPTSSGKTFISSYVVRKVLEEHRGMGRVVIVVPTKSLVLQIQGQLAKDFHDVRNLPDGRVVQGTFTRDFRQHSFNCVALVTVPQCLEILFLSSAHEEWVSSIKYIIFDEVQCITEPGGGVFWERSLLATRCPFLALSATIGNPEVFTDWLRRVKQKQKVHDEVAAAAAVGVKGADTAPPKAPGGSRGQSVQKKLQPQRRTAVYDVHLLVHKERFNDVTGFIFLPSLESLCASAARCNPEGHRTLLTAAAADGEVEEEDEIVPYGPGPADVAAAAATIAAAAAREAAELPPAVQRVAGRGPADGDRCVGHLLPLHPLISVDLEHAALEGKLPPGMSMTPGEMLQLYDGMVWQAATLAAAAATTVEGENDGGNSAAVAAVQQRLAEMNPERAFAPLQPAPMPTLYSQHETLTAGGDGGHGASSLVVRDRVKIWEKLLLEEVLLWIRSTMNSPAAAGSVHRTNNVLVGTSTATETAAQTQLAAGVAVQQTAPVQPPPCDRAAVPQLYGPWKGCLQAIQNELSADTYQQHRKVQQAWAAVQPGLSFIGISFLYKNVLSLVLTLQRQEKLPAIFFNFSRNGIVNLGCTIVKHLEAVQERYRNRYKRQLTPVYAAAAAAAAAARNGSSESSDDDDPAERSDMAARGLRSTVLIDGLTFSTDTQRPDPSFSLIPLNFVDDERLLHAISRLRTYESVNPDHIRMLEFGVGVHHGGLSKAYRQEVELLFRAKIIQVVIATGTLAMGVHMPCRTVVMAGDSSHLDALNYRQMSGRSGRRGLDTLGHVVFYGLPLHRVHRLRTAPMPQLHGQMLVTPTTTLRLLFLDEQLRLKKGTNKTSSTPNLSAFTDLGGDPLGGPAVDLTLKILSEPFMATDAAAMAEAAATRTGTTTIAQQAVADSRRSLMRHTLGLSLVYLLRSRLVDPSTGRLQGLAGLATHLFWTEPSNLVLCRLIHAGVFVRMCNRLRGQELKNEAILLLAHLFIRIPMPPSLVARVRKGDFAGTTSSVVKLPQMRKDAAMVVQQYNNEVFGAAVGYVLDFALQEQQHHGTEGSADRIMHIDSLPYSGISFTPATSASTSVDGGGGGRSCSPGRGLSGLLRLMRRRLVACSPFMSLSGCGDEFQSVPEMLSCVRQGVELQSEAIPVLELRNRRGHIQPLNAWMYDFFKTPSLRPLLKDNQMREGDVWDLLTSAKGVLTAIALALELAAEAAAAATAEARSNTEVERMREEELAAELKGDNFAASSARTGGGGSSGPQPSVVESLGAELDRLQKQKPPRGAEVQHSALMVAKLFRLVANEFSCQVRDLGT